MKAIIKRDLGHAELVSNHPIPHLPTGYLLIKTKVVALNPIDWMQIDYFPAPNTLLGHDYAGIIEAVGAEVSERFNVGQRVCGYTIGGDHLKPENGAFAEYVVAKAEMQYHIPDHMSFEEAATLGAAVMTAGMGLYLKLGLAQAIANRTAERDFVLIYGGSTSSGAMAVQVAAQSGYRVLSTCSAQNADYVKSLGAEQVFDYKDPECGAIIRTVTENRLSYVLDTIANPGSASICAGAMSSHGGDYVCLLPVEFPRSDIRARFMDATTCMGEYYEYGADRMPVPVDFEAFDFSRARVEVIEKMFEKRTIRPHQVEVGPNGLGGVFDGLQRLKQGRISAKKLVYRVDETP